MTCSPLNEIYGVMPPVTLDCDKGAPVGGAKCLVKCKDGASRATHSEINCICNSKTCKWQEWKQLKKNEIKCLNPNSGSKSESAGGDMCDPLPKERWQIKLFLTLTFRVVFVILQKVFKKYWSGVNTSWFSCGDKPFSGTCKFSCPGGQKPSLPKFRQGSTDH